VLEAMVTVARFTAEAPPVEPVERARPRGLRFADVVERQLAAELARRLALTPHQQLGLEPGAADEQRDRARARLRESYQPAIFTNYSEGTRAIVARINQLIEAAHAALRDPARLLAPPPADAERAQQHRARLEESRQALALAIQRRTNEACAYRDLGRLDEAVRSFEAVLALDRKNDYARGELRRLRERLEQQLGLDRR
jgi:tetratricopeptide (TPR) repeat protein